MIGSVGSKQALQTGVRNHAGTSSSLDAQNQRLYSRFSPLPSRPCGLCHQTGSGASDAGARFCRACSHAMGDGRHSQLRGFWGKQGRVYVLAVTKAHTV